MKLPQNRTVKFGLIATVLCLGFVAPLVFWSSPTRVTAQTAPKSAEKAGQAERQNPAPEPANPNAPAPAAKPDAAARPPEPPRSAESQPPPAPAPPPSPNTNVPPTAEPDQVGSTNEIQLSFQGANVDMIVQWLAKTTGKSVVKHPRAQCQLTIVSSKKLSVRDAIDLVYRALALEGFNAVETSKSILIVPEGQEPKMGPELVDNSRPELPEGRQRLMKFFSLKNTQAADLRDRIRAVLSDKGTVEVADRSNQLIVTDYTENIRLLGELIKELDIAAGGDIVIQFYPLKYSEAEELGNLLSLVLNAQPAPPSAPSAPPRSSSPSSRSMSMFPGGGIMSPGSSPESPSSPPPSSSSAPPSGGGASAVAQPIRIWPDKTSNRLIVAAPKSKLAEVERLIALLDTEKPQDVSIRVLPLKNVSAEDLVKDIGPLFLKMSGKSLKDTIEVTANSRGNSLVVLSSESNFKAIGKLVAALDTEEAQEKSMRTFALKNADAEDVAKQLQDLNQDQDSSSRYPYYMFSSYSMGGKSPKKATFVADRRRNTVIVQAPPSAMESIAKMIQELDEPLRADSLAPKIFRLKYVSASDIEDVLNELFLKKQQQRTYWDPYSGYPTRETESQAGGRLSGKVRITSEPYANAIIVTANSPENLAAVEEVIKQLDVSSQAGETTLRVELKFAKASTVANNINILFAKGGSPPLRQVAQPGQPGVPVPQREQQANPSQGSFELGQEAKDEGYFPWLGGQPESARSPDGRNTIRQVSDLVGRVRVVPDQRSNSLLVSANLHLLPQITKLIEELDAPTAQVLIEAKIVEVSTDFLDKLGVRWSPDGSKVFTADDYDNSILARGSARYTKGFGGITTVNSPASSSVASALTSLRSGVLDSTVNLDLLVQFLRKTADARVLAEPQVNIADNELGKLFVGQQVPIQTASQNSGSIGLSQSFSYRDVGVILEVTPHINKSGDVALRIRAESSSVVPGQIILGGAVFDTRSFKTDLTAKNGQTLVLGGIIQKQVSDTVRKVPILGSIPLLGWAFKKKDKTTREVELMVFLRPKIVRTPEEAKELMDEMEQKAPHIKEWRDENRPGQAEDQNKRNPQK